MRETPRRTRRQLRKKRVAVVVFALLVVFSGCGGIWGDESNIETVTPVAVPTDPSTSTPMPRLAPGLTRAGIENASALAAAHDAVLDGKSFTIHETTIYRAANGTPIRRITSVTRIDNDGRVSVRRRWSGATALRRSESYFDGKRRLVATIDTSGEVTYRRTPLSTADESIVARTGSRRIERTFTVAELHVADRSEEADTMVYRFVPSEQQTATLGRSVRVRATVDGRGLVRDYTLDQQLSDPVGNVSSIRVSTRYTAIGSTTVESPAWYERALAETNATTERAATPSDRAWRSLHGNS